MTPQRRDRNLVRVRRATGVIACASLAATGLFAGLAASKAKSTTTPAAKTTTRHQATTTTQQQTTTEDQTQTPAIVVTPTQQAPVASSGGS